MTYSGRAGTYPADAIESPTEKGGAEAGYVPLRRFGGVLTTALLKRCARLLPTDWPILLWSRETDETIIASLGPVEICQIPAGCTVQTCVKGDMDVARGTALQRLARYVSGDNRSAAALDAERPILQQWQAPGLWLVTVRLAAIDDVRRAPVPRTDKVRIMSQNPATLAVINMSGHPSERSIARAEAAIIAAIADTHWVAAGPAIVRMHVPSAILPFAGSFEVAVPVCYRSQAYSIEHSDHPYRAAPATSRPVSSASLPVR